MNIDDFWCRAFLAAMGGTYTQGGVGSDHGEAAFYAGMAADAALEVAKRRGMIAGDLPGDPPADPPRPAPALERVEFTAEQADHGQWVLRSPNFGGCEAAILVVSGRESFNCNGAAVHIKWGETSPPKPIEVWIERPAASPAPPGMSDAEVAAEFYRRFKPAQVILGTWGGPAAAAEVNDEAEWCSEETPSGEDREGHAVGAPGFVAAVLRARELVRKGGA